jgi:hypothetical protein
MMTASAEHYSNVSRSLIPIYEAHWETGNEVNSKSAAAITKQTRYVLEGNKTHWHIEVKDGKRRFVYKDITRPFGDVIKRDGTFAKFNLSNTIQFRTYGAKGITMVATNMPGGQTEIRENGKIVSTKKVDKVGRGSIDILQKLNFGLDEESETIKGIGSGIHWFNQSSHEPFKGKHTKGTYFIEEGRRNAMGQVHKYITQGFKEGIERREKSMAQVKTVRVA